MPLYEYYCADCRATFETLRPLSQVDSPIACRNCASTRTSRTISLFAPVNKSNGYDRTMANGGGGCGCGGSCSCRF